MRRALFVGLPVLLLACSDDGPKTYGPVFDAAVKDGASDAAVVDGGTDASSDADAQGDASNCTATTALLAGNGSALVGASAKGTAALTGAALTGSVTDRVSVVPFGAGFLGVARAADDSIVSSLFGAGAWAAATTVGAVTTRDAPMLAVTGTTAHLAYQQKADFKFYHGQYTGSAWDAATDPVGVGVAQSYGPRGPGFAAVGTTPVVLQAGDDGFLYDRDYAGSAWSAAHQQAATSVEKTLPPTLVALVGGSADLLGVYMRLTDFKIMSVTRTSGTWSAPVLLDVNAYANDPVNVAPMSGGRALLAYRGSDGKGYFSVYDPAKNPVWTVPAAIGATAPLVESAPAIAPGVCGDDAVVAYAATGGSVNVTHFAGGTFGAAAPVSGTGAAKYVGIATQP